jgi:hypothetical protein
MKPKEREKNERRIEDALREMFGRHLVGVEFWYHRGGRGIFVTYEDFKPYEEVQTMIRDILQGRWKLTLQRIYSNERIKDTLFDVYNKNRVAVVDMVNGELKPYTIRNYIHNLMMKREFFKKKAGQ